MPYYFKPSRAFNIISSIGKYSFVAVGIIGALLYYFQNSLIYPANMPSGSRSQVPTPDEYDMAEYEHLELESPDHIKVKAYLILQGAQESRAEEEASKRPTVILFHANAGNMGHRLPIAKIFYRYLKMNVFLLSYRGYGQSQGSPDEKGIRLDAQTALDHVLSHPLLEKTKIILYGQSLGGAVAIDLASRNENRVHCVVVENTFWSLKELVPRVMPYVSPFLFLLHQRWETGKLMTKFRTDLPFLFLSGVQDELVPPAQMEALYEKCSSELKLMKEFSNGTHNDTCIQPGYFEIIAHFIKSRVLGEKDFTKEPSRSETLDAEKLAQQHLDEDLAEMGAEAGSVVP